MAYIHPLARNRHPAQADEFGAVLPEGAPCFSRGSWTFSPAKQPAPNTAFKRGPSSAVAPGAGCAILRAFCEAWCLSAPAVAFVQWWSGKILTAREAALAPVHRSESGMGTGFRARCAGERFFHQQCCQPLRCRSM